MVDLEQFKEGYAVACAPWRCPRGLTAPKISP
jgi:hypothetical protein